jgi:hypothetical protein
MVSEMLECNCDGVMMMQNDGRGVMMLESDGDGVSRPTFDT